MCKNNSLLPFFLSYLCRSSSRRDSFYRTPQFKIVCMLSYILSSFFQGNSLNVKFFSSFEFFPVILYFLSSFLAFFLHPKVSYTILKFCPPDLPFENSLAIEFCHLFEKFKNVKYKIFDVALTIYLLR